MAPIEKVKLSGGPRVQAPLRRNWALRRLAICEHRTRPAEL